MTEQGCYCGFHVMPFTCAQNCRYDHRFPALGHSPWCPAGAKRTRATKPVTEQEAKQETGLTRALANFLAELTK